MGHPPDVAKRGQPARSVNVFGVIGLTLKCTNWSRRNVPKNERNAGNGQYTDICIHIYRVILSSVQCANQERLSCRDGRVDHSVYQSPYRQFYDVPHRRHRWLTVTVVCGFSLQRLFLLILLVVSFFTEYYLNISLYSFVTYFRSVTCRRLVQICFQ